ncbi:hypothetical protein MRB53_039049 [Persea americana]|nr:hypothetical protein MRB53_039049 [Persea americana]
MVGYERLGVCFSRWSRFGFSAAQWQTRSRRDEIMMQRPLTRASRVVAIVVCGPRLHKWHYDRGEKACDNSVLAHRRASAYFSQLARFKQARPMKNMSSMKRRGRTLQVYGLMIFMTAETWWDIGDMTTHKQHANQFLCQAFESGSVPDRMPRNGAQEATTKRHNLPFSSVATLMIPHASHPRSSCIPRHAIGCC